MLLGTRITPVLLLLDTLPLILLKLGPVLLVYGAGGTEGTLS